MLPNYELVRLEASSSRPPFNCNDDDLNDFYQNDSVMYCEHLLAVTYIAVFNNKVLAYFSVANDSIKRQDLSGSGVKRVLKYLPRPKRLKTVPAVKIGRLATCRSMQSQGLGTNILDFIKVWFTEGNKIGCRYIIVDAYNNKRALKFYDDNGFIFLSVEDKNETTRLMYFDLKPFKNAAA